MQFRHGFYFIALLSAGCNIKYSETISDTLNPQERAESVIEKPREQTERIPEKENKPVESVERFDSGVEIVAITEQWAKENGLMDLYQADPGFTKWCVLFHDIPVGPPYKFQQKRLLQASPDVYYPCPGP